MELLIYTRARSMKFKTILEFEVCQYSKVLEVEHEDMQNLKTIKTLVVNV